MTKDKALLMALEAMESVTVECNNFHHPKKDQNHHWAKCPPIVRWDKAITAIKEALAQPEQDWRNAALRIGEDLSSVGPEGYYNMTAQQWLDWAMEQKPRGNNSLAQPEQEPVAWLKRINMPGDDWDAYDFSVNQYGDFQTPLYTTPPQRTWVGLTDEERKNIMIECESTGDWAWELKAAQDIEAKLKQKNGFAEEKNT